jgi:uncharacterized protein YjbJ (UPF0337 family)
MGVKIDVVKGRIEEAAGTLIGSDKLRSEGKTDQAIGKVKQIAEKAVDKVEQAVRKHASEVVAASERERVCFRAEAGPGFTKVRGRP